MRVVKGISAEEMLDVLNQPYASTKDIQKIAQVGITKAQKYRNEMIDIIEAKGYRLPNSGIPMNEVVEYFNIDINYLKRISKVK